MPEPLPKYANLPPWLRWLLLKLFPPSQVNHPGDLDGYSRNDAIILKAFLDRDLNQLKIFRRLSIPVPEIIRPMTIVRAEYNMLHPYSPQFYLPWHFYFCARLPLPSGASRYTTEPETAVYFFVSDESTVMEAESMLQEKGLLEVARKYPGKWYTRDPYWCLKPEGEIRIGLSSPMQDISVPPFLKIIEEKNPPLEEVLGYPLPELEAMQRRIDFYQAFAASTHPPTLAGLLEYNGDKSRIPDFPDSVLFGLSLPQPTFSADTVSLKILPSGDASPALMQSFITSLRPAEHPIAFELIDDGKSAYMQVTCHEENKDLVSRQLRLHFPKFGVQENKEVITGKLFGVSVKPTALYQPIRTIKDFPLDPLGQLFAILDEAPPDAITALQVLFFPLPDEAILTVTDQLQERSDRQADSKLTNRIRQGLQKLPAWQVTVRLLGNNRAVLSKLRGNFFGQYQVAGQSLTFSEDWAAIPDRDMSDWTVLSTSELAAFAHFPVSESLV